MFDHPSPSWVCVWCYKFLFSGLQRWERSKSIDYHLRPCKHTLPVRPQHRRTALRFDQGIVHAGSMMQISAQFRRLIDIRSLCPGPGETEDDAASAPAARLCVRGLGCRKAVRPRLRLRGAAGWHRVGFHALRPSKQPQDLTARKFPHTCRPRRCVYVRA